MDEKHIRCYHCGTLQEVRAYCENCGASFTGFAPQTKTKSPGKFAQLLRAIISKLIFMIILAVILYVLYTSPEWVPDLMDYVFDAIFETFGVEF